MAWLPPKVVTFGGRRGDQLRWKAPTLAEASTEGNHLWWKPEAKRKGSPLKRGGERKAGTKETSPGEVSGKESTWLTFQSTSVSSKQSHLHSEAVYQTLLCKEDFANHSAIATPKAMASTGPPEVVRW